VFPRGGVIGILNVIPTGRNISPPRATSKQAGRGGMTKKTPIIRGTERPRTISANKLVKAANR